MAIKSHSSSNSNSSKNLFLQSKSPANRYRRGGGRGNRKEGERKACISFFITEFGDKWKTKDLFFEFKDLREIDEVVIPPKRDRNGRRYGFVHFLNVKDVNLLAIKMDNVVSERGKLFANFSRFERGSKENTRIVRKVGGWSKKKNGRAEENLSQGHRLDDCFGKRSFAEVLQNSNKAKSSGGVDETLKVLHFVPDNDDILRYKRAFAAVVKNPEVAGDFKRKFLEEGLFSIRIMSLGPKLCLLEDLVCGETELFVEEKKEWWSQWFSSIKPWDSADVDKERLTWLRLSGIPCHA
ncbi:uncharacterized protein LOC131632317 [Vicia villosa]|uniref:uncharacterized protein LOC131632317 n=1 Tax=Vicia villosa TaxID=3911 RepID=UPI00273C4952|nr:uncharacterized protein LOC131632317 [Vicia villosa]